MKRTLLSSAAVLALGLSLGGCATLRNSPQVDVAPAQPVHYRAEPAAPAVTGSLFSPVAYRPAFEDPRARLPGDSLTIQIAENVTASQKSSSSIDRAGDVSSSVTAAPFMKAAQLAKLDATASSTNTFSGKGGTESANKFEGSITATVMEVLPNGHLLVAGEKQIGVNENVDVLRFSGTVDPRNIRPGNVVASTQVANARIASRNQGAQGEVQAIGWLSRFFLSVMPF
ncbi:MAG: flagellar basal body L-ring protein FlgH [Hydrogenophaga sp.]|uniref:flagellar basal body L-ring protein FlgH n=1 Tax=Hydrogenophaga sp. TaxID=1904254 RepID=UPI003D9B6C42